MTQHVRLALPWAICLGVGTWLSILPGRTPDLSGPSTKPAAINKAVVSQKRPLCRFLLSLTKGNGILRSSSTLPL